MFESLTNLITTSDDGEGLYARIEREVRAFVDAHHEYDFDSYEVILKEHGILSDWQSMADADVSGFDDKAIMALLVGALSRDTMLRTDLKLLTTRVAFDGGWNACAILTRKRPHVPQKTNVGHQSQPTGR